MTAFLTLIDSEEGRSRFCAFYEKYIGLVFWIAKSKLNHNSFLAEECAQETFLYFAKNFSKVGDLDSPGTKAFVGVVATAFAIKCFHKEIEKISDSCVDVNEKDYDPHELDAFDTLELKSAVDSLDDELKNLIYLKYFFGFKNKEISDMTGASEYLVRTRLLRALKTIKNHLKEDRE